jgi:hypothetical protein
VKLKIALLAVCLAAMGIAAAVAQDTLQTFQTRYARIQIDDKGFITSLVSLQSGKEYSPAGHPSPVMSLHEYQKPDDQLIFPTAARFDADRQEISLTYGNGAVAVVKIQEKDKYFRFQLVSLTPRGDVDNIEWGPLNTTIRGKMGDLIGVVRDPDWAIGMFGLNDNTIAGPPVDGDSYEMSYYIHSPDPKKWPLSPQYHEGQWFAPGGNGISDVAFYSHPEEYFNMAFGTGAKLEPEFGSSVMYHARDRRKVYTYFWSLSPGFEIHARRHQVTDPLDVDFMGSAVALYACPDDEGLHVIENIILAEGLPHPTIEGKWMHAPGAYRPGIAWNGPHDRLIEYADALGFDGCRCEDWGQGEYYANPADHWAGKRVEFADGSRMTYKEFTDQCNQHGIKYGLHTLCLFLQPNRCTDVSPVANEHLQTVCRTHLASDISETDTNIVVNDPSLLVENGTWPVNGTGANYVRIGGEIISYKGISKTAPYTLIGVKRGYATTATAHKAGDEAAKLQQNCYNGFCPDMTLMPKYADYYAQVMAENGMKYIDFDGLESTIYMNQGYYGVRVFFRRFFNTYAELTGGGSPVVGGSCIWPGGWLYMASNGGMFDPVNNRWNIEGKDLRNGYGSSYTPCDLGIENWHTEWSIYDAENLEAKSIGGNRTFSLGLDQHGVELSGEKEPIFKAFRTWEAARDKNIFTPALKEQLEDLGLKFHLEQKSANAFVLYPIKETRISGEVEKDASPLQINNPYDSQPMQFSLRMLDPAENVTLTLPDGSQIKPGQKLGANQFIINKGDGVYLADKFRRKIVDLDVDHAIQLPSGESKMSVQCANSAKVRFELVVSAVGKGQEVSAPGQHI